MNSDYLEKARIVELPEIVSDKKARSGDFDTDSIRLTSLVASMASLYSTITQINITGKMMATQGTTQIAIITIENSR